MNIESTCSFSGVDQVLSTATLADSSSYTFRQRLRSGYHGFWYRVGEGLRWSRGTYREQPAVRLSGLTERQQAKIGYLKRTFTVRYERYYEEQTALKATSTSTF